jgi:ABC-2 type transport system permease protein
VVTSIVQRMVDEVNGAWLAAAAAVTLRHSGGDAPPADELLALAGEARRRYGALTQGQTVEVAAREPRVAPGTTEPGVAAVVLPGMMVFWMFIAAMNTARGILEEDQAGTLPRLFTTPTPRGTVLAGKLTSVFLVVLSETILLLVAGLLLFRIDWGDPLNVAILTLVGTVAAASLGVLVMSFLNTPAQAGALSAAVVLVLALLGGNFVSGLTGGWFNVVRRLTPNGWLLIAWDRTIRGAGLAEILVPVAVLLVFSLVTFTAGTVIFRRRYL